MITFYLFQANPPIPQGTKVLGPNTLPICSRWRLLKVGAPNNSMFQGTVPLDSWPPFELLVSLRFFHPLFSVPPMGRPKLLRVDERGSSWGTLPKQWHTQWEKLIERMETGLCRLFSIGSVSPCVCLAWFCSPVPLFGRFTPVLFPQALGLRYSSHGLGSKGSRLSDSSFKKLFCTIPLLLCTNGA